MNNKQSIKNHAIVGVADHAGWAVLVTVGQDGTFLDRRRVELVDNLLPKLPHHHECQALPIEKAIELVKKVEASAHAFARNCLVELSSTISPPIAGIAIRQCPPLPATIAERIKDYKAQCVADTVMYRHALAHVATAMGWCVSWYEAKTVFADAGRALNQSNIDELIEKTGALLGPPWQKDHRMAMAAAIAATTSLT